MVLNFWGVVLSLAPLLMHLGGCSKATSEPSFSLNFRQAERIAQLPFKPSAASRSSQGLIAAGDAHGRILLRTTSGQVRWLGAVPAASQASSQPIGAPGADASRSPHRGAIVALVFSRDGQRLLSAGGKTIALWSVAEGRLLHQLRGPQRLTAAVFGPRGKSAYFATDEGHVLRWGLDEREAEAQRELSCGARIVNPLRRQLPRRERCPFGRFGQQGGHSYCVYPATHLVRQGFQLARACRTGDLSVTDLASKRAVHAITEGVGALGFFRQDQLVIAENEGRLTRHSLKGKAEREARRGVARPKTFAALKDVFALGHPRLISVWSASGERPAGGIQVAAEPVWLVMSAQGAAGQLEALLADGALMRFAFTMQRVTP